MGQAQTHALAREQKIFPNAEGTFGTLAQPAGTDACKVTAISLGTATKERVDRADNRATRSVVERITSKTGPVEWNIEAYIIPSGTAGTPPDLHEVIKAAMGAYSNTPATSDAYTLTDTQAAHGSISLHGHASATLQEAIKGGIVQEMSLKGNGVEAPMVTFSGVAADQVITGRTALAAALSGGEADIVVDSQYEGMVGSLIQVGTSDGAAAGHVVSVQAPGIGDAVMTTGAGLDDATSGGTYTGTTIHSTYEIEIDEVVADPGPDTFKWRKDSGSYTEGIDITGAAQTLGEGVTVTFGALFGHTLADVWTIQVSTLTKWTVDPVITGGQAIDLTVIPFVPTETTAGTPLPGTIGSITLDGESLPALSWEMTLSNNHVPFHDEAFQAALTDYVEDVRGVRGQLVVRARADQTEWLGKRAALGTMALTIVVGTTAGKILTISCPYVELEFAPVEKPQEGSQQITLPFKALGSSGADELALTFT